MKKSFLLVIPILLLVGGYYSLKSDYLTNVKENKNEIAVNANESFISKAYADFEPNVLNDGQKKVLFFHASWCPACREDDKDIRNNLDQIPTELKVYKTDYDAEGELKKKYDITSQDTFVYVDGQGNEISKWMGGGIDRIKNLSLLDSKSSSDNNYLTIEQKLEEVNKLALQMSRNGMKSVRKIFPDLIKVDDISSDDSRNLMGMGPESWEYSAEGNITVVVCSEIDSPIHVFMGRNISDVDVMSAKEMMDHEGNPDMMDMEGDHTYESMNKGKSEGKYLSYYDSFDIAELANFKEDKILFFYASWCPNCRNTDEEFKLNKMPDGVVVFKLNYDEETELKKKYGITSQHTFVLVDGEGNEIKKWLGGGIEEIQNIKI